MVSYWKICLANVRQLTNHTMLSEVSLRYIKCGKIPLHVAQVVFNKPLGIRRQALSNQICQWWCSVTFMNCSKTEIGSVSRA